MASVRRRFRPAELEAYASCPFRHFCDYTLGLETIEEEVTALNRGTILHDVLCRLFRSLRERAGGELRLRELDIEAVQAEAVSLLDAVIEQDAKLVNLPDYRRDLERKGLASALCKFLQKEISSAPADFLPSFFELDFGSRAKEGRERDPNSTTRPLVLYWDDRSIEISGKIDRVDIDPNTGEAFAIDYKLNRSPNPKDLENGRRFQAPLYALALSRLFDLQPLGTLYKGITKRDSGGYMTERSGLGKHTKEEFEEWLRSCEESTGTVARSISAGEIPIAPADGACGACGLDSICRIDLWKRLQMQTEGSDSGQD
jgi:ATP-dependent helicase/DNAse subunit B